MKLGKGILGLTLFMACPLALADSYQYELSIDHSQTDSDLSGTDITRIGGTYYLRPVDIDDVPLSEAAFVNQSSSLSLKVDRNSVESTGFTFQALSPPVDFGLNFPAPTGTPVVTDGVLNIDGALDIGGLVPVATPLLLPGASAAGSFGADQDTYSIAGEYITQGGWITGLGYSRSADDTSSSSTFSSNSADFESETISLTLGRYIQPMTSVSFEYRNVSTDFSTRFESVNPGFSFPLNSFFFPSLTTERNGTVDSYSLRAKTLARRWGYLHKLEVDIGYDAATSRVMSEFVNSLPGTSFRDKSHAARWGVAYALYPRNDVEIGVGYSSLDPELGSQDTFNLSLEWFIKTRLAIRADYISTDTGQSLTEVDGYSLGITGRF